MKFVTAVEAKNAFGQFLEASQREPVIVTKNRRAVAALLSMHDLEAIAEGFLAEPLQQAVEAGSLSVSDAILEQLLVNRRLAGARQEIAEGKGRVLDQGYFDQMRARIRS